MQGKPPARSDTPEPRSAARVTTVEKIGLGPLGWGFVSLVFNLGFVPSVLAWATGIATLRGPGRDDSSAAVQAWFGIVMASFVPLAVATCVLTVGDELNEEFLDDVAGPVEPPIEHAAQPADRLVLPANAVPGEALPLAIWLHGYGATPFQVERAVMQRHAESRGLAILGVSGPLKWVDATTQEPSDRNWAWTEEPLRDEARIREAIESVSDRLSIQPGRIALFGFSQGGMVAAQLASRFPGRYSGAIILSPGSLHDRDLPDLPSNHLRSQGYLLSVGAGEHYGNRQITRDLAEYLQGAGAQALSLEVRGQNEHTFPPRFDELFGQWIHDVLKDRGGLPERVPMATIEHRQLVALTRTFMQRTPGGSDDASLRSHVSGEASFAGIELGDDRVERVIEQARDEQRAAEAEYPKLTANDRLEVALAKFERRGLWIGRDLPLQLDAPEGPRYFDAESGELEPLPSSGFIAYSDDAVDLALAGEDLWLRYGAPDGVGVDDFVARMMKDLEAVGLSPALGGARPGEIRLTGFVWQRRIFSQADARELRKVEKVKKRRRRRR